MKIREEFFILVSKINKCYNDRYNMDLESHEFKFIEDLKKRSKVFSKPLYNNGLVNGSTDSYLTVTEKQSDWFNHIYEYKGLLG